MTSREIVKKRLNHEGTPITPYAVYYESEIYRKLTEYYQDPAWESKKLRQFIYQPLTIDTVLMEKIDDVYSRDAYGALWRMDRKPWHLEKNPLDEPDMTGYNFPTADVFVKQVLDCKDEMKKLYAANTDQYRVIYMGWGIFEHSWRVRGFENALTDMITDEDFYFELTQKLTDNYIAIIKACEDIENDAYMFGDDWGDQRNIIMGKELWRKFIKPCWARIFDEVHRQGKTVVHHSCGSVVNLYDDLIEIGMDVHESVQPEAAGMAPEVIKEKYGKRLSFWGCLGSQGILYHGTPKEIEKEIIRLHHLFREDGGFLLAPAKPLLDEMPVEKAVAVIETLSALEEL